MRHVEGGFDVGCEGVEGGFAVVLPVVEGGGWGEVVEGSGVGEEEMAEWVFVEEAVKVGAEDAGCGVYGSVWGWLWLR